MEAQILPDYEANNWYRATHPESQFVKNLICARPVEGRRLGLLNNAFTVRQADGSDPQKRLLEGPEELMDVLEQEFGLTLPGPRATLGPKLQKAFL